jgi:putative membrane protein
MRRSILTVLAITALATGCIRWFRSPPKGPTDANLAAILLAANNTDISYAQLAPARAQSTEVKQFAARMLGEHTAVNQSATDMFAATHLVPQENVTSLDFRDESAAKRDTLRELSGHAFDSAYAVNEVNYHTHLLTALDSVLIPRAKAAELKNLFVGIRPAVASHLEHAQRMRASVLGRH